MEKPREAIAIMTFIAPARSTWKALFRRRCKLFWIAEAASIRSSCSAGGLQKQSVSAFYGALQRQRVEARGVEPLSSSLSTQTSTCLSGVSVLRSRMLHRHAADSRASARFDSPVSAVAPPTDQPAVHVSDASRRRSGNVAVN